MTHDELLAKINSKLEFCTCEGWGNNCWADDNKPWIVLRSILELHNPREYQGRFSKYFICESCSEMDFAEEYPCPTIKAIEKGLTNVRA